MAPDHAAAIAAVTALGLPRAGLMAINFLLEEDQSVVVVKYNASALPGIAPPDAGARAPTPDAPVSPPVDATVD